MSERMDRRAEGRASLCKRFRIKCGRLDNTILIKLRLEQSVFSSSLKVVWKHPDDQYECGNEKNATCLFVCLFSHATNIQAKGSLKGAETSRVFPLNLFLDQSRVFNLLREQFKVSPFCLIVGENIG